jgi:hypothetical protein
MKEEIMSKRTIAVLLVLSMLFSVFGTLAVLDYLSSARPEGTPVMRQQETKSGTNAAGVTLTVMPPEKEVISTGHVTLEIKKVE